MPSLSVVTVIVVVAVARAVIANRVDSVAIPGIRIMCVAIVRSRVVIFAQIIVSTSVHVMIARVCNLHTCHC